MNNKEHALLIVLEGTDCSGKETHSKAVVKMLCDQGYLAHRITFPDYESDTSALVKMYLNGDFGKDLDPKIASTFYAVDRVASFHKSWKKLYDDPKNIIIADRYTTSNITHQCAKIAALDQKKEFIEWLEEFEYGTLGLPRPDKVLMLDMHWLAVGYIKSARPVENKTGMKNDIHEDDKDHIKYAYENVKYLAGHLGWEPVMCTSSYTSFEVSLYTHADIKDSLKDMDVIQMDIYNRVTKMFSEYPSVEDGRLTWFDLENATQVGHWYIDVCKVKVELEVLSYKRLNRYGFNIRTIYNASGVPDINGIMKKVLSKKGIMDFISEINAPRKNKLDESSDVEVYNLFVRAGEMINKELSLIINTMKYEAGGTNG